MWLRLLGKSWLVELLAGKIHVTERLSLAQIHLCGPRVNLVRRLLAGVLLQIDLNVDLKLLIREA